VQDDLAVGCGSRSQEAGPPVSVFGRENRPQIRRAICGDGPQGSAFVCGAAD